MTFRAGRVRLSGPPSGAAPRDLAPTLEALRERVRFDDHGRYRPLSGARTMPRDWRVSLPERLTEAAMEVIYPQALLHQEQAARGALRIATFDDVAARQQGRYRVAGALDAAGRARAREALCGRCLRTPLWAGVAAPVSAIPCPEPCSVLIALCREVALWRREPPPSTAIDPQAPFADFAAPGNEIREAYLASARTPAGAPHG